MGKDFLKGLQLFLWSRNNRGQFELIWECRLTNIIFDENKTNFIYGLFQKMGVHVEIGIVETADGNRAAFLFDVGTDWLDGEVIETSQTTL